MSGNNVLPLKHNHSGQQQAGRIRAADTRVMPQVLPGDLRLEYVAPEVHVGSKEVRPQMFEELHSPNNVET